MIRLNGVAVADAAVEAVLERAVVEQAGQVVGLRADLDRLEDLRVLQRDRDLGREQLDQLELLGRERVARARAARSSGRRSRPSRPRSGTTMRLPSTGPTIAAEVVDPRVVALVRDVGRLVVLDDPRRDAGLARRPRLEVVVGVDAAGRQRRRAGRSPGRRPRSRRCRSAMRPPSRSVMLSRTAARVERRQDRLGDLEQLALAAQLPLERGGLLAQPLGRVGVGHRLGGEAGVDHEQAQVVVA